MSTIRMRTVRLGMIAATWTTIGCAPTLDIRTRDAYGPGIRFDGMGDTYDWWPGTKKWIRHARATNMPGYEVYDYIAQIIARDLERRGFEQVTEGTPSFYVAYRIQKRLEADYDIDPHGQMIEEGSVVVDAVDPPTDRIIWRGIASAQLNNSYSPEVRRERVEFAIDKLMQKFPARTAKEGP